MRWRHLFNLIFKRLIDVIGSSSILIIFSPLFFIVSFLIYLKLGRPIFFRQIRPGFKGRPIKMLKFRTMKNIYSADGKLLPDHERFTKFGNFLRKYSLDELPELFSIFTGHMSFVGPRPLLMEYLERYNTEQARRHEVKPGLTGWAQINGRNAISWDQKFQLDIWYVDNWNVWVDIKIIFFTFICIFKATGINYSEKVTMPVFEGNNNNKVSTNH